MKQVICQSLGGKALAFLKIGSLFRNGHKKQVSQETCHSVVVCVCVCVSNIQSHLNHINVQVHLIGSQLRSK